jgi:DNA-binding MarR family transcriptional regulator
MPTARARPRSQRPPPRSGATAAARPRARSGPPAVARRPLSARDLAVLELAAQHRLFRAAQVARLLSVAESTARSRLSGLLAGGWLTTTRPYDRRSRLYQITTAGLRAIDCRLPRPRLDLTAIRHDLGVGWLWLAAHEGAFGPLRELHSERELRSGEMRQPDAVDEPLPRLAVRSGERSATGRDRVHFPDLLLVTASGRRVALELELSGKGRRRTEQILAGYAADRRVDAVLYLTDDPALAERIRRAARRAGCGSLVRVVTLELGEPHPAHGALAAGRTPVHARAERGAER